MSMTKMESTMRLSVKLAGPAYTVESKKATCSAARREYRGASGETARNDAEQPRDVNADLVP